MPYKKLEHLLDISTLPVTLKRVNEVISKEHFSLDDLVKVIESDQALATRVVGMANSAFYGLRGKVLSIKRAAVILGYEMVRNIAVSVSLFTAKNERDRLFLNALWHHSFEVALASSLIAEEAGIVKKEDAFFAGLINDIGRVVLYQAYGPAYIALSIKGSFGLEEREYDAYGFTHPGVGAWFGEAYNFHEDTIKAIRFHHTPERWLQNPEEEMNLTPVVYIGDCMVSGGKEKFAMDIIESEMHEEILQSLCLSDSAYEKIKAELKKREAEISKFYAY